MGENLVYIIRLLWGHPCTAHSKCLAHSTGTSIFTAAEITAGMMVMLLSLEDHGDITLLDVRAVVLVVGFLKV